MFPIELPILHFLSFHISTYRENQKVKVAPIDSPRRGTQKYIMYEKSLKKNN